jgi:hypothetical protein
MSNITIDFSKGTLEKLAEIGIDGNKEVKNAITKATIENIKYLLDKRELAQAELMLSSLIEYQENER